MRKNIEKLNQNNIELIVEKKEPDGLKGNTIQITKLNNIT